ncbi:MAG: DMT family transporter [Promethearchaeota archaeon]
MSDYNLRKGLIFGAIVVFLIGLQPIIANSRPSTIDPIIFAAFSALIGAILFCPIYFLERKKLKRESNLDDAKSYKNGNLLIGWKQKRNILVFILIGITFSVVPVMLFIGFELTGAINSSLALKSEIVVALFFGFIILKEKISILQVIFCGLLFFGLILAITEGFQHLVNFDIGVLIIISSVVLFTFVHTITKAGFDRGEIFPSQVVFIRNLISSCILIIFYAIIFPIDNFLIVITDNNLYFFLMMGIDYGLALYAWYKTLTFIEIGKASIVISFTPIISSFFSFILLGETFTIFHLIGMIIVIFSIFMIVRKKTDIH